MIPVKCLLRWIGNEFGSIRGNNSAKMSAQYAYEYMFMAGQIETVFLGHDNGRFHHFHFYELKFNWSSSWEL